MFFCDYQGGFCHTQIFIGLPGKTFLFLSRSTVVTNSLGLPCHVFDIAAPLLVKMYWSGPLLFLKKEEIVSRKGTYDSNSKRIRRDRKYSAAQFEKARQRRA